jgi:hypothetical protein
MMKKHKSISSPLLRNGRTAISPASGPVVEM